MKARQPRTLSTHGTQVEQRIVIEATPEQVYRFWRTFEHLPRFMTNLKSVTDLGGGRSRWVADGPAGRDITWEAEILRDAENEFISWQTTAESDVEHAGSVHFSPHPEGCEVTVELRYHSPAGKIGASAAKLFGEAPEQQIAQDLRRLKELMEQEARGPSGSLDDEAGPELDLSSDGDESGDKTFPSPGTLI